MTFETVLKNITGEYLNMLRHQPNEYYASTRALLREHLQAKLVEFHETGSEAYIVAPGLAKHTGREDIINSEFVTYQSRNSQPAILPQENGLVIIHWLYKMQGMPQNHTTPSRIEKIAIEFKPKLPLPKEGTWNPLNGIYHHESAMGILNADYLEAGKGHYHLLHAPSNGGHHDIELNISVNRHDVRSIRFKPDILGTYTLTSFFADMGWQGLEKLVE